jgi:hypothetical protein
MENENGFVIGRMLSGARPRDHRPSNVTITFPRSMDAANVGGRITEISMGSPDSPGVARCKRGPAFGSALAGEAPARGGAGVASPGDDFFSRCK